METNVSIGLNETVLVKTTKNTTGNYGPWEGLVNLIKSGAINDIRTGFAISANESKCINYMPGTFFSLPPFMNEDGEFVDTKDLYLFIDVSGDESIYYYIGADKYWDNFLEILDGKTEDGRKIMDGGISAHKDLIESISYHGLAETYLDNYTEMLLRPWHKWYVEYGDPEQCEDLLEVMEIPYIAKHLAQYKEKD